ncbi:hypothetical protein [Enterococcus xiangfangensis]|uniref:Uncharacterized protein n=1 Tax=Enterococcus xiangfangensis TaxID=1296537 RepID=A0ABU3FDB7_9ENTE|nr:hypothetical protein [Enterococcus xiangfangensis]MBM7711762.1 hypothetical protein [Enterococcus xiangfangensis]MDT2760682.1 hypothetical protein [Enterococcus xiangfangensis]NBK07507.1 hypothetical protein [Enterococcus asini]
MNLDPKHRYAQQATKMTQRLFVTTSILTILFILAAFWQSWWWLLGVTAIVVFWAVYSSQMRTVPIRDLTTGQENLVESIKWQEFKKEYPNQVAKNGAKS